MSEQVPNVDSRVDNSKIRGWLSSVSLFFYRQKTLSLILLLTILIFGSLSYTTLLKREGFPSIEIPITLVKGTFLIGDAQKVDSQVAIPLAETIAGVEGVESVRTSAGDNFFTAIVFSDDTLEPSETINRIKESVENSASLPEQIEVEVEAINPAKYYNSYDSLVAVYSQDNSLDTKTLSESSKVVAGKLTQSENIISTTSVEQFSIGLNPVTGEPVFQQTSFGRIGMYDQSGEFILHNAVTVGVVGGEEVGTLELADSIESVLDQVNSTDELNGAKTMISADSSRKIENQINSLQSNMLTALLAVAFISFLFISWRASVTTGIFMIAVMSTTLGILFLIGYSLNTIVLFGLVLALGLFVDDATIITEAIDADKEERSPEASIKKAIRKVALASFAGTFTTVLVFTPLLFLSGILGEFIRLLPITVIVSLVVSLVLSLTLIPFLSRYTLLSKSSMKRIGKLSPINRVENSLARFFSSIPMLLRKRRKMGLLVATIMVGLSIVSVAGAVRLATALDFNIFPQSGDSDDVAINIVYKSETTIEQAQDIADDLSSEVVKIIGESNLIAVTYGMRLPPTARSTEVLFELTPFTERATTSLQMIDEIDEVLAGYDKASFRVYQIDAGPPAEETPFKMQIFGEDTAMTSVFGREVAEYLDSSEVTMKNGKTANITKVDVAYENQYERIDGKRYIEVKAGYDGTNVSALVTATQTMVEEEFSESDLNAYSLSYENDSVTFDFGQETENAESFNSVLLIVPIALGLMFLLLALQFRSIIKPLIIFMAIPFSLFGVFFGLTVTGNPMSFFVVIGLIGLIGIVVNNAILLVDYANQDREMGKDAVEAVSIALRERFRPLITTTTITVVALLPLAVYDPFWEPLAVTIIFGLISSTIMVVIAFPYYYIMADNIGSWINKRTNRLLGRE